MLIFIHAHEFLFMEVAPLTWPVLLADEGFAQHRHNLAI